MSRGVFVDEISADGTRLSQVEVTIDERRDCVLGVDLEFKKRKLRCRGLHVRYKQIKDS